MLTSFPLPTPSFQCCFPGHAPPWCGNRLNISLGMVKLLLEVHPSNMGRGHPTGDTPQGTLTTCPPTQGASLGTPTPRREDPTSSVGGHVGHFLEGIQEGNCGQHRGPGEERARGELSRCGTHSDVPTRRGVSHVPPHLGHSPELGVQLGGLRVEIFPYGVGALQGGRVMVRDRAPRPLHRFPRQGRPPLHWCRGRAAQQLL